MSNPNIGELKPVTKVRIDLAAGTMEAEGSEEFIRELYQDFRERVGAKLNQPGSRTSTSSPTPRDVESEDKLGSDRKKSANKGSSVRSRTPVLIKDLDLATKGSQVGLKDFIKRYRTLRNSQEQNSLFVYYLARVLGVKPINIDHVYTCYKDVGVRVPGVLPQSLWDTARRKGTVDTTSLDDIKLTLAGENWVEHDLEKAKTAD